LRGEIGEELRKRVWCEVVEALERDFPAVKEVVVGLEQGDG